MPFIRGRDGYVRPMTRKPSHADLAAVARLLGNSETPTVMRRWTIERSGGLGDTWTVEERIDTKLGGTYLFCPCASWRFNQQMPKECKHTREAQSDDYRVHDHACDDCGRAVGEPHNPMVEH